MFRAQTILTRCHQLLLLTHLHSVVLCLEAPLPNLKLWLRSIITTRCSVLDLLGLISSIQCFLTTSDLITLPNRPPSIIFAIKIIWLHRFRKAKDVFKGIKKRLGSKNRKVQLLVLTQFFHIGLTDQRLRVVSNLELDRTTECTWYTIWGLTKHL
ncbi:hypothetical protein Lser_V15G25936 [Lactuca serriola]